LKRIDSHQHFWNYDPIRDSWMAPNMEIIQKDFLPSDLKSILERNGFEGSIVVQSDSQEIENDYQMAHAKVHHFIKGIVGWVDLCAENVDDRLAHYAQFPIIKGFRHILQAEPQVDFMLNTDFRNGISHLAKYGFIYEILVFPRHLKYAIELVSKFPNQKFVIDHLAKPYIKSALIEEWAKDMKQIAKFPNVWCKASAIATEAHWDSWKQEDFEPYLKVVFDAFSSKRIMFGSDWPVCTLAGSYEQTLQIFESFILKYLTLPEIEDVFYSNAVKFYKL
jgi:L-fuconolactonase